MGRGLGSIAWAPVGLRNARAYDVLTIEMAGMLHALQPSGQSAEEVTLGKLIAISTRSSLTYCWL